jgi:hypothetical protein
VNLVRELERLLELYSQLRSMAQVNVGLLKQSDFEALDDAWRKRKTLFNKLCQLRGSLNPVFDNWDAHMAVLEPDQARRCAELSKMIVSEGKRTLELDESATELLTQAKDNIKGKLDHIRDGRKALKAYRSSARAPKPIVHISKNG